MSKYIQRKISTWNINSATNKNILTPNFVGEEIKNQDSDFFVLTEFCRTKNYLEFCEAYFLNNGYEVMISDNVPNHNDILIAWKKDKYECVNVVGNIKTTATTPNFAYVILRDLDGREFALAGVRITIENYYNRKMQFKYVLKELRSFPRVVIAGDFNCLRRGTSEEIWNIGVLYRLCKENHYELKTPKGSSIYTEKSASEKYEFAEDHFIVKGIDLKNEIYDRNFTEKHPEIYLYDKDFAVYDRNLRRNIWSVTCGSGIPDHAILTGFISFEETTKEE